MAGSKFIISAQLQKRRKKWVFRPDSLFEKIGLFMTEWVIEVLKCAGVPGWVYQFTGLWFSVRGYLGEYYEWSALKNTP